MPEQPTDQTSKLASLRKALLAALTLPESHRVHAAQLAATDPDAAETFLGKGVADREADVKAALDADPIVFRGELTGAEVRRSEGPRMLELAKSAEESRATIKRHEEALAASSAQRETAEVASFCKGKLASLPGSDDVQQHIVGLLRAAGGPLLEPSLQALAAASANIAKQSKAPGATTEDADPDPTPVDALAAWNKAVEAYATKHSISDRRAATAAFLSTSEGRAAKATYDASRAYGQKPGGR